MPSPATLADIAGSHRADQGDVVAAPAESGAVSAPTGPTGSSAGSTGWSRGCPPHRAALAHGDAGSANLLPDPDARWPTTILDWGDPARADPATDFVELPLRVVPPVLEGCLGAVDEARAARVPRHRPPWAIACLPTPAERHAAHRGARPGDRLMGTARFLLSDLPPLAPIALTRARKGTECPHRPCRASRRPPGGRSGTAPSRSHRSPWAPSASA